MRVMRGLRGKMAVTIVCGAVTTAACVDASDVDQGVRETAKVDSDALGLSEKSLIVPKCKGQGCGDNGIMVRDFKFHELNANGWPNAEGVSLRTFLSPPDGSGARTPLWLNVDGDVLTGSVNGIALGGQDLVGAQMILDRWSEKGVLIESYLVELEQVDIPGMAVSYWIDPGTAVPIYRFGWRDLSAPDGTKFAPLCDSDLAPSTPGFAVVFQGDRYDPDRLIVRDAPWIEPDRTWFNISCVGNVIAKMHFLRHTAASSDTTHVTSPDERTALLKMITGDYCGNGYQFTVNGVPLRFVTRNGWHIDRPWYAVPDMPADPEEFLSIDAVWSHRGAECLDVPRLVHEGLYGDRLDIFREMVITVDPDGACWPSIDAIPLCADRSPVWEGYGYALSGNPADRTP